MKDQYSPEIEPRVLGLRCQCSNSWATTIGCMNRASVLLPAVYKIMSKVRPFVRVMSIVRKLADGQLLFRTLTCAVYTKDSGGRA